MKVRAPVGMGNRFSAVWTWARCIRMPHRKFADGRRMHPRFFLRALRMRKIKSPAQWWWSHTTARRRRRRRRQRCAPISEETGRPEPEPAAGSGRSCARQRCVDSRGENFSLRMRREKVVMLFWSLALARDIVAPGDGVVLLAFCTLLACTAPHSLMAFSLPAGKSTITTITTSQEAQRWCFRLRR